MRDFPYLKLIKKSFRLTIQNPRLWVFGLFIGGLTGEFLRGSDFTTPAPEMMALSDLAALPAQIWQWVVSHGIEFLIFALFALSAFLIFVILQGLSKGAVIWTVRQLSLPEKQRDQKGIGFKQALWTGAQYFSRVVGLQVMISMLSLFLLAIFVIPVGYLFFIGAVTKAVLLLGLGMVIFVPVMITLAFVMVFGPIFIVAYQQKVKQAVAMSIRLFRRKFREAIVLAILLWLAGLIVLAISGIIFAVFGLIGIGLSVLTASAGAAAYSSVFFFIPILIGIICVIVLESVFAVFHNVAWVLAVEEMVRTVNFGEELKTVVVEPAA